MKMLAILLIIFLPLTGLCQTGGKQFIKIPGVSLDELVKSLLNAGYAIEKSEASLSVIVTHLKKSSDSGIATQIRAKMQAGNVVISGEYVAPGQGQHTNPITDSGAPGSPCMESWKIFYQFAESFNKPLEVL